MIPIIPHFSNECLEMINIKKNKLGQNMMKNLLKKKKCKYCYSN